jgi:hypothetical protein
VATKICSLCKEEKDISNFHKRSRRACGVASACKECRKPKSKAYYDDNTDTVISRVGKYQKDNAEEIRTSHKNWRAINRNRVKSYALKNKYNLSFDDYNKMALAQNGLCLICGKLPSHGKPLVVDHNHETGEIRGLLCTYCNLGLGMFKDSKELLTAALEYLWR